MIYKEILRWYGMLSGYPLFLAYFKKKVYYEDKSVQNRFVKGAALIVSNHFHVYDFIVNAALFPFRKLYVVLKSDVYQYKFTAWGMSIFGGIKSDRDEMGMRFIDESVAHLKKGRLVQIFPEAYITHDGKMHDFKTAYIMIAQRADVPIIPVVTDGNYGWKKRTHVIIGTPILLSDFCPYATPNREQIVELNEMVRNKCLWLQEELHRRIEAEKNVR